MQKKGNRKDYFNRTFQAKWKEISAWVYYNAEQNKVFCSVCEATKSKETQTKVLPHHMQRDIVKSFVYERFNNWRKNVVCV